MPDSAEVAEEAAEHTQTSPRDEPRSGAKADRSMKARAALRATGSWVVQNNRTLIPVVLLIMGIVFVTLGWYGAAYTNIITEQVPYLISGGLLGLGLIIVAGFMASSAMLERRSEELRRDLLSALAEGIHVNGSAPSAGSKETTAAAATKVFVLEGGHSYHLAGCPILEGKDGISEREPRAAARAGFAMCKLCGPE